MTIPLDTWGAFVSLAGVVAITVAWSAGAAAAKWWAKQEARRRR